jgi:hypothetical protein
VLAHGRAFLTKNGNAAVLTADAHDPASILEAPETTALIDFSQSVALLFVALLHFVTTPAHHRHVPGSPLPGEIVSRSRTTRPDHGSVACGQDGQDRRAATTS